MKPLYLYVTVGLLTALALSACNASTATPTSSQPLPTDPAPARIETETPVPTETLAPTPVPEASSYWWEYRDARYGYGLSLPCFWIVTPTPNEGSFATMTARNFTDEFRQANSIKGYWEWPNGAKKIDVTMIEDVPQKLSPSDAAAWFYNTYDDLDDVLSIEEATFGQYSAVVVSLANKMHPEEQLQVAVFRPAVDRLMLISIFPAVHWDGSDFQAILASLALSPAETVTSPAVDPAAPPDGSPLACQ